MKTNSNYMKYIIAALVLVFFIAAALLLVSIWERREGRFPESNIENGVLTYQDKEYVLKKNIETFLVLGLDKYEGESTAESHKSGVQADFLMLFVFDNNTKQCRAVHINRDTMTAVNKLGIGGVKIETATRQIALAYSNVADANDKFKCMNTKVSVEQLLHNVQVDHYLALTMDSVAVMNDLVGGVEVTVLDDFTGIDDTLVKGEKVTLQGAQALRYVRTRYGMDDSTNSSRMERQQQYITVLSRKILDKVESDEGFVVTLGEAVDKYVAYDSSSQRMQKYAEKLKSYEFLGIVEIEGETKMGEEFVEFYPNEDLLLKLVIDLFYQPKGAQ